MVTHIDSRTSSSTAQRLLGKKILVTGSSKGIGRGIAVRFAQEGADVVINYNSDPKGAEEALAEVRATGRNGAAIQGNTGSADAVRRLVDIAWSGGEYAEARRRYVESVPLWREVGDPHGLAGALGGLGLVATTQGDLAAGQAYHEESVAALQEIGDLRATATARYRLGAIAMTRGDCEAARHSGDPAKPDAHLRGMTIFFTPDNRAKTRRHHQFPCHRCCAGALSSRRR